MNFLEINRDSLLLSENPKWLQTDLVDGTNVTAGADVVFQVTLSQHDVRLDGHSETVGWRDRASRVLSEFRELRKTTLPISAFVIEKRFPGSGKNGHPSQLSNQDKLLAVGGGLHSEPCQLFDQSTLQPIAGLFPFLDAGGTPILFSDGRAAGYRLGLSRQYAFIEKPRGGHDDRKLSTGRLFELCAEAGVILLQLPPKCLRALWHRWGQFRNLPRGDKFRWIDSVFEFEWSNSHSGTPVTRSVFRSDGYGSLELKECGLFPRAPLLAFGDQQITHQFPTEAGYPFEWGSELADVASASINLLEWIVAHEWNDNDSASMEPTSAPRATALESASPTSKRFRIALSFPGEHRNFVRKVAERLGAGFGRNRVLYDDWYEAEFARVDLDTYLQKLYHDESELIAVFLCSDYEQKEWCGLEWRAIRDLIKQRRADDVMPLRFDNTQIPGLFSTDGYVWIGARSSEEIAELIIERRRLNRTSRAEN